MAYFRRKIDAFLSEWKAEEERKPLLLRGARQVGKTTAVRHLAESFEHYVEVDLNERKDLHYLFNGRYSPQEICQLLGVIMNTPVQPGRTLYNPHKFPPKIQYLKIQISSIFAPQSP